METLIAFFRRCSRSRMAMIICTCIAALAVADYFTGYEMSFSFFYLGAISLCTWFLGSRFALTMSFICLVLMFFGDVLAGAQNWFVAAWNAILAFASYYVMVATLTALRSLHDKLEEQVAQRTVALTEEMEKREGLEREILEIGERERRRIGHDLHDGVCQHLTATAIAAEVLREELEGKHLPQAAAADRLVSLVEEGINLTRTVARGLAPVEMEEDSLMTALRELAKTTSDLLRIDCRFECLDPVMIPDASTASHLYRIAQEAVTNAVKHGRATAVTIRLSASEEGLNLSITDNGAGLPAALPEKRGMGPILR